MKAQHIKVLLIEDNPGDARLIQEMLTEARGVNFDFECTNRLSTGLERIGLGDIDIILLDLTLPDSKGFETFIEVHAQVPNVPIVLLSGLDDEEIAVKAVQEGAQDYLVKGRVDSNLLTRSIRYAIERKQVEEALRESEEKFRVMSSSANDAIIMLDNEGKAAFWNEASENIFGYTKQEILGRELYTILPPGHFFEAYKNGLTRFNDQGEAVGKTLELKAMKKDGTEFPIELSMSVVQIRDNWNTICIVRDITERKRSENQIRAALEEKEVLLKEIHHRVKNNLQVISSLLKLQSRGIKDEEALDMFKESQNRVKSMALIHEKLYQSKDLAKIDLNGYIRDLVGGLFQSYAQDAGKIALKKDVEDISLGVETAIPCGLIINELVSNALKHAFPDGREGEINIKLCSSDEDRVQLTVSDNGIGIPENLDIKNTESLGLHLVTILAEDQLQGKIKLDRTQGTEFQIEFKRGK